ncbi:MAG TPA: DUF2934 domain-containing protein [Terriglobales bacterium]|nr:DUF2934 domain-containing protein [Terriglobales bacterium]
MKSKRSAETQLRTYENEPAAQVPVATPDVTVLSVSSEISITEPDVQSRIRDLAYQLYLQRGCVYGHDVEDWLEAESIVRQGEKLAA